MVKQTLIPVQLLTVSQIQELIKNGQDVLLDAVSKKSNVDKKNLIVRRLNPTTDFQSAAGAPGAGQFPPGRLGDGTIFFYGNEGPVTIIGWQIQNDPGGALIPAGTIIEYIPEFTVPDDRGIIILGIIDRGTELAGVKDTDPVVDFVRLLTGGNAIIDQWSVEELEIYEESDGGPRAYAQTQFPYIDEDQFRIQMSFNRAIDVAEFVRVELLAYVVEKYGKVISKKAETP